MMYPRLKLARNLLTDDGFVFISIDDAEVSHLQEICNEIFGEQNYVACAPRKTGAGSAATRSDSALRKLNDYILIYSRTHSATFKKKFVGTKEYPFEDEFGSFRLGQFQASGSDATRTARPNMWYPIYAGVDGHLSLEQSEGCLTLVPEQTNGQDGRWLWNAEKFIADSKRFLYFDGKKIYRKLYYDPVEDQSITQVEKAWFEGFTNAEGTKETDNLFNVKKVFSHPKPVSLLKHLLALIPSEGGVYLDFFAGSGTTAHAIMQLNSEDGGNRRCISVQLPEPTDEKSEAFKAGYTTISEITRERIRRAGAKILKDSAETLSTRETALDVGFRAYRLVDTNFKKWTVASATTTSHLIEELEASVDSARDTATDAELLTELLLKLGFSLTEKIESVDIAGLKAYSVSEGLVLAYLNEHVKPTLEQLRELVALQPAQLILLEDCLSGDDELKTNLAQECRSYNVKLWTV